MIIVGIDPGNNGGIALLRHGQLIYADHLPIVGKTLSAHLLNNWFADIVPDDTRHGGRGAGPRHATTGSVINIQLRQGVRHD
jgi:hypothetical protein